MNSMHTELVDPLPWYEMVFMSASLHRIHHARNLRALSKNYGSVFSIWDRMLGTYEPEWIFGQTQYVGVTAKEMESSSSKPQVAPSSEAKLAQPLLICEDSDKSD